jgi:hypothetical protein
MEMASELHEDALGSVSGGVATLPGGAGPPGFNAGLGVAGASAMKVSAGIAASGLISCVVAVKASKL